MNRLPHPLSKSTSIGDRFNDFQPGGHYGGFGGGEGGRRRNVNVPSINTGPAQGTDPNGLASPNGAQYDLQLSQLLPSTLLLGSPYQPATPNNFASPQFTSFGSSFGQAAGQMHGGNPMSPGAYGGSGLMSPQFSHQLGLYGQGSPGLGSQMTAGLVNNTSRTVYLGNIPPETSAEEILGHVRSGQIESVRLLQDKNCCFISFLDGSSATHFHSDAILKKLCIRGQDIKVGWGKPSQVPTSVALAVQQSGASRNVYLGNLPEETTEEELREDLGKFGPIDTVKIVREKAIGFVHFLSIGNAIKAVAQLPQEPKWQSPRRVYYGKDRCAYVSKTQQQNAAQYLGIQPGYAHVLNTADRDLIQNALAQQSVAAAAVATSAGGPGNLGNRTVYLGNIHPETTIEEICNVVRGGLLHHIRYIPDKHICFVTFIDPTAAASFYALSNLQGLMIHNRRLKIGWGKHSGQLPPAIALAVSGGASRNVYVGNLDESWSEDRLRQDFSEYGEIELVNALREKSCAFVNFTNIANAIKAIEAVRGKDEYKRFKINFGKDRCGNPPRQSGNMQSNGQNNGQSSNQNGTGHTPPPGLQANGNSQNGGSQNSPTAMSPGPNGHGQMNGVHQQMMNPAGLLTNVGNPSANPLQVYLQQHQQQNQEALYSAAMQQQLAMQSVYGNGQAGHDQANNGVNQAVENAYMNGGMMNGSATYNNNNLGVRHQHTRAVSLPVLGMGGPQQGQQAQGQQQQQLGMMGMHHMDNGMNMSGGMINMNGVHHGGPYGLGVTSEGKWSDETEMMVGVQQ